MKYETILRREDRTAEGEPIAWSMRSMFYLAHKLNVRVTWRACTPEQLVLDGCIGIQYDVMTPEQMMRLGLRIEIVPVPDS